MTSGAARGATQGLGELSKTAASCQQAKQPGQLALRAVVDEGGELAQRFKEEKPHKFERVLLCLGLL